MLLSLFLVIAPGVASAVFGTSSGEQQRGSTSEQSDLAEKWGIEVVAVRMSAAGNMVDFRYKVLDAQKADKLFNKESRPNLIHQKTGKVLAVPRTAKVGPLMSSYHHKQGRIYWMFFGNQTKLVKAGDKVTVVVGDFKTEDLVVQ